MEECSRSLDNYRMTRSLENWKKFKKVVKNTKRSFFDMKIQEVANKSCGPWELMNWITRANYLPSKPSNMMASCVFPQTFYGELFTPLSILCFIVKSMLMSLTK